MADFTPVDTFTSPVPALSDGQPANAAVLNAPHQALVNRTHWLKETIDSAGITRDGATRIREVADEAALKALTGMQDGELAITQDRGLVFRYSASASEPELARWVVAPNTDSGRWVNTAYKLVGGANGIVKTDANERIPAALPKNGVVAIKSKGATASKTGPTPGSSSMELESWELDLGSIAAGDRIDVAFGAQRISGGSGELATVVAALAIDDVTQPLDPNADYGPTAWLASPGGAVLPRGAQGFGHFVAQSAGHAKLRFVLVVTGGTDWEVSATGIRAVIYRP